MTRLKMHEVNVAQHTVLPAAAARVWGCIRDFNSMPEWHASVVGSHIVGGPADRIGCLRVLDFGAGGLWTHQLTGLSDEDMVLEYRIVDGPQILAGFIQHYRARMQVSPAEHASNSSSKLLWEAWFQSDNPDVAHARAAAVFEAGFHGIRQHLHLS